MQYYATGTLLPGAQQQEQFNSQWSQCINANKLSFSFSLYLSDCCFSTMFTTMLEYLDFQIILHWWRSLGEHTRFVCVHILTHSLTHHKLSHRYEQRVCRFITGMRTTKSKKQKKKKEIGILYFWSKKLCSYPIVSMWHRASRCNATKEKDANWGWSRLIAICDSPHSFSLLTSFSI